MKQPLLLRVSGLSNTCVSQQTLGNLWNINQHEESLCLASMIAHDYAYNNTLFERVTWAFLAWPQISKLILLEEGTGCEVARIQRQHDLQGAEVKETYYWTSCWLESPVSGLDRVEIFDKKIFPPLSPHNQSYEKKRYCLLAPFGLSDTALASRERIKQHIQGLFGSSVASYAHRLYQEIGGFRRRYFQKNCLLESSYDELIQLQNEQEPRGKESLSILFALPRLSTGGAESVAINLIRSLIQLGISVCVVTTYQSENSWGYQLENLGINVTYLPEFLPEQCWCLYINSLIHLYHIQIIHISNSHWLYASLPYIFSKNKGIGIVSHLHAEGELGTLDFPSLAKRGDVYIDHHTVISNHLKNHMLNKHGIAEGKVTTIRTGLAGDYLVKAESLPYGAWRAKHHISDKERLIVLVGRFSELKRPLLFLAIAERLLRRQTSIKFVMKGEGSHLTFINEYLDQKPSLRNYVIIEDTQDPVPPLMRDADLMLLTSEMEGIAMVSFEAMVMGLPQVSSNVGGQSELINENTGVLVDKDKNEIPNFVSVIESLLNDEVKRKKMSVCGRERIAQWPTADDMAIEYRRLYWQVINDKKLT